MARLDPGFSTWRPPLELTTGMARPRTGRPYSPYPYRDLPVAANEPKAQAHERSPAFPSTENHKKFHLFPYLPTELRLHIWRQAALLAARHGRVYRVCLAVTKSSRETSHDAQEPKLELVATAQLAQCTRETRALLASCYEAREEALHSLRAPSDSLPLQGGGVLRCNLEKDVIVLEGLSPSLLLQIRQLRCQDPTLLDNLSSIRHIGLDFAGESESFLSPDPNTGEALGDPPVIPSQLESAMLAFAASLPQLRQIYLLQTAAAAANPGSEGTTLPTHAATDYSSSSTASNNHYFLGNDAATEWYSTRPLPSYWVDDAYYEQLNHLMRLLCGLRETLDAPLAVADLDKADLDRLRGIRPRILRHYATMLRTGGERDGGLQPSSPERCLEVGLGRAPRWMQWEWVCQCLGC